LAQKPFQVILKLAQTRLFSLVAKSSLKSSYRHRSKSNYVFKLPFGEEINSGTGGRNTAQGYGGQDSIRQKFTGYERDTETDLDFAQARMYNKNHGRFTSPDPIMITKKRLRDPQSINLYAYSRNNPLKYIDPTGEYFVGTNGKRVGFKITDKGKIVLGKNASADLVRMARLINKTGSETARTQFADAATNETKNHFKIEDKSQNNKNDLGYGLLGLHQAHDKNGKPLKWEAGADGTGKFDGQPAYIKDKDGNMIYKEATITIFAGNIDKAELAEQQRINKDPALTKSEVAVGVFSHEVDHNTNQDAIDAIRDRQQGRPNNLNVEEPAELVEKQVFEEIKKKRP
jgi:RHS repeat-associated protein